MLDYKTRRDLGLSSIELGGAMACITEENDSSGGDTDLSKWEPNDL